MFSALRHVGRVVSTTWNMVGVCLAALVLVELTLLLLSHVKDTWIDPPWINHGVFHDTSVDYQPQPWEARYELEYSDSWRTDWHSYVYWRRPPYRGDHINIDSRGVRRTWVDPAVERDENVPLRRVFVFGGSTIWGTGARDDYTIPSFLAKHLGAADLRVEVINLGESAYVGTQEVITLMLRLIQGDVPDAVVFYDGFNDTFTAYQNGVAGIPQNEFNRRTEFGLTKDPTRVRQLFFKQLPAEFQGLGRLAAALRRRLGYHELDPMARPPSIPPSEELAGDVVRNYEANVQLVQALADSYGFSCHFFWQPALVTKKALSPSEIRQTKRAAPWKKFFLGVYDKVQKSKSLSHNENFQDISNILDGVATTTYLDWAHVTEEANDIIAQRIAQQLIPSLQEQIERP